MSDEEFYILKEIDDNSFRNHVPIGRPFWLIKEFLKTLIDENHEDIIEKKYIVLKNHYIDLFEPHVQDYQYEWIGMAEKFMLNYILDMRKNWYLRVRSMGEIHTIIDIIVWKYKISNFVNNGNLSTFANCMVWFEDYVREKIDIDLLPDNIKAIKNRNHSYYEIDSNDTELLNELIESDFYSELRFFISSEYQSMFREISELFMQFLQEKIDKAELEYKKVSDIKN